MADYYLDYDAYNDETTETCTFTNGSTTVTCDTPLPTGKVQVGDYVRPKDETTAPEWYKVTAVTDDGTQITDFTIDHKYYQDTISSAIYINRGDGTQSSPFCCLRQYIETSRSAGDILHVQKGQVHYCSKQYKKSSYVGLNDDYIWIEGDDWKSEGSTENPTVDFQNADVSDLNQGLYLDKGWCIKGIKFRNYASSYYARAVVYDAQGIFEDLVFENCRRPFYNCGGEAINLQQVNPPSSDRVFDGGKVWKITGGSFEFYDAGSELGLCSFSWVENLDVSRQIGNLAPYVFRNSAEPYVFWYIYPGNINPFAYAYYEDINGAVAHKIKCHAGVLARNTDVKRENGASDSIEATPSNLCSAARRLFNFNHLSLLNPPWGWVFYLNDTSQHTVTFYLALTGWTTLPTVDELWLEVEYYDQSTGTHKAVAKSTSVDDDTSTWNGLTDYTAKKLSVTFTPAQTGLVRVRAYLAKYESGAKVYVDNKLYVS